MKDVLKKALKVALIQDLEALRDVVCLALTDALDVQISESEAMVLDAARMMLDINRRHLSEFLITHPYATYEEWIAKLHPDNVTTTTTNSNNNGGGGNKSQSAISIDHRFYVEDSDHRKLWNEMIEDEREFVPVRSLGDNVQDVV